MEHPEMGPPKTPLGLAKNGKELSSPVPVKMEPPPAEARAEHIWSEAAGAGAPPRRAAPPPPLSTYPYFVPNRNSVGYF